MAACERRAQKPPCKPPSFSSSLLDAIYHSIDQTDQHEIEDFIHRRRNNVANFEQDVESLKRAILIEKWMENHSTSRKTMHFPSNSGGSSTDSSVFSSSETESSAARSTTKSSVLQRHKQKFHRILQLETVSNQEGSLRMKSRAEKIVYGESKKAKEPGSPRVRIANFLNSIFSTRSTKANQEEWRSVRKSRSMKETTTTTTTTTAMRTLASRSCLSKNASSKSTRTVRFCLVGDEDCQKNKYNDELSVSPPLPTAGSQFIKKNIESLRRKQEFEGYYRSEGDVDCVSCGSSDLFELENIGRVGIEEEEELPIFGTTSLGMNQNIAGGLVV